MSSLNTNTIQTFSDETPLPSSKTVLLFGAAWHEACVAGGAMDQILGALAEAQPNLVFGRVDAEANPVLASTYQITAVPTFVLLNADGEAVETIVGLEDAAKVTTAVQRLVHSNNSGGGGGGGGATTTTAGATPSKDDNTDDDKEEPLAQRLDRLIRSAPVMVFIKGTPTAPRCGFSRQIVELLQDESIPFGSFDILSDEAVRQGLKTHSDWPTYPQLYVNGELVGGLDIVKEMKGAEGSSSLREQLLGVGGTNKEEEEEDATQSPSLQDRLKELVHRAPVMLFMKGLPSQPKCGFSRTMVQILDAQEGVSYDSFDILTDEAVRQGLKEYSDWPTYPQLYIQGELIGGLDIVQEMLEDGSLQAALDAVKQ